MKNGVQRYYRIWNKDPGPNYYVIDRTTGKKVFECYVQSDAEDKVRALNETDRKERGIVLEAVETPSDYSGFREKFPREIAPMTRHGVGAK